MRGFVAAVAMLLVVSPVANAEQDKWTELADQAYAESVTAVEAADAAGQYVRAQFVAPLAWYAGQRFGWRNRRTVGWLHRLYSLRTPSGGYGLGAPFDAFGDGTVNPPDTAYTITGAWHVGRVLIAEYDGGGVPAGLVRQVARQLAAGASSVGGKCPTYSDHPNDAGKPCVWNVSAAAAWFLDSARKRGLTKDTAADAWLAEVRAHYRADLGGWTYQATSATLQDPWHNAATVGAVVEADPDLGALALAGHFRNWPASGTNADLLPYDCGKAASNFAMIRASATKPASTPAEVLQSRTGFAPLLLLVAKRCG